MKKVLGILVCLMMLSTAALASPLMDYSSGKGSVDLTWRNAQNSSTGAYYGTSSTKYNLDGAITFGLGNNFAIQYRTFNPESDATPSNVGGTAVSKISTNEFNLLYKLDKNVAIFTGVGTVKGEGSFSSAPGYNYTTQSKTLWQLGVVGNMPIGAKTNLWASAAAGGDSLTNWEIGVSYEFSPGWEFDVNYREVKADTFTGTNSNGTPFTLNEAKSKGAGFGVTYKF